MSRHDSLARCLHPRPVMMYDSVVDDDYVDQIVDSENTTLMRELIYRLWERVTPPNQEP